MLALYLGFAGIMATHIRNNLDPSAAPLGYDFSAYYEAAQFARAGQAAAAYDDAQMIAAERARFPGVSTRLPWNYPPVFLLFLLPFSYLPYAAAWALWTALLLGTFTGFAWRLVPQRALWPVLLFPGAVINFFLGANGLLSALLLGGTALLARRPAAAGVLLGCAVYKPHLAILVPLVLLAGGNLRALGSMLATTAALVLLSLLAFGGDAWTAFFVKAAHATAIAGSSSSDWRHVPTMLVLMKTLGLGETAALFIHGALGLLAALSAAWIWRRTDDPAYRMSALALGTLMLTPYARVYDLALLMFPIALSIGAEHGRSSQSERLAMGCAWIAPLAGLFAGALTPWLCLIPITLQGLLLKRIQNNEASVLSARL